MIIFGNCHIDTQKCIQYLFSVNTALPWRHWARQRRDRRWNRPRLFLFGEDDELVHHEVEAAGEAQGYEVADYGFEGRILHPVHLDKQEVNGLHGDELDDIGSQGGNVIGGKVAPEGAGSPVCDAVFPKEIIGNDEVGHGRQLERDGGSYPETAPIIAFENEIAEQPVHTQVYHSAGTAGNHEQREIPGDFFGRLLHSIRKVTK